MGKNKILHNFDPVCKLFVSCDIEAEFTQSVHCVYSLHKVYNSLHTRGPDSVPPVASANVWSSSMKVDDLSIGHWHWQTIHNTRTVIVERLLDFKIVLR